jgi:hypothetical protein
VAEGDGEEHTAGIHSSIPDDQRRSLHRAALMTTPGGFQLACRHCATAGHAMEASVEWAAVNGR